jgi:lysophospholipase L1-like esterase
MYYRRVAASGLAAALAMALCACTQLQSTTPPASGSQTLYDYTAIGASDAVGYGASVPCATAAVTIGADVELLPSPPDCLGGTGYVPDVANMLAVGPNRVQLTDLGISGSVIGPDIRAVGNTYEPDVFGCASSGENVCVPGDFLSDELPLVSGPVSVVTIFAGGNDTDAIFAGAAVIAGGGGNPTGFITAEITAFGDDYLELVGAIQEHFPAARIYIANLPNFGLIPRGVCLGATVATAECPDPGDNPEGQFLLDQISTSIDADVINVFATHGIPVVDLECDAQSYNPANFYTDGFHPNDAGYKLLAQSFTQAILARGAAPPSGNCGAFSSSTMRKLTGLKPIHLKAFRY